MHHALKAAAALLAVICISPAFGQAVYQDPAAPDNTANLSKTPSVLDLTGFAMTFNEDFDTMDIVPDGKDGKWFAPVHGQFSAATFLPPSPDGPFFVKNGFLTIRATKVNGKWTSGLMQSVDSKGRGFAQQYGYFEMRAKGPEGPAMWWGFWLASQKSFTDPKSPRGEIDVLEGYTDQPDVTHTSVHLTPWHDKHWFVSKQRRTPGMSEDFHRYGVMIDPTWIIFYFDGTEIYRFPTLDQFRTPFYMLVSLPMTKTKSLDKAIDPSEMVVDYVRVYAKQ